MSNTANENTSLTETLSAIRAELHAQFDAAAQISPTASSMEIKVRALLLAELQRMLEAFDAAAQSAARLGRIASTLTRMRQTQDQALIETINTLAPALCQQQSN